MKNWTDTSTKIMKPPAASAQYAIWWTTNRVLILLSSAFSFEALKVGCPFREDNCFIAALSDDWSKLNWGTSKKFYLFVTDHDWKDRLIVHKTHFERQHRSFWWVCVCIQWKNASFSCAYIASNIARNVSPKLYTVTVKGKTVSELRKR